MGDSKSLLLKEDEKLSTSSKAMLALLFAILFFVFASPALYGITDAVSGALGFGATAAGFTNVGGLILHSVVVFAVAFLILHLAC